MSRLVLSVIALFLTLVWTDRAFAERRVALIIGNSAYQNAPILPNPGRDARGIADMFQKAGYEITTAFNVGNLDFKSTIRKFEDTVTDADIAVIYYAGYGLNIHGTNYLIPIDAKLASDRDANDETITLEQLVESVHGAKRLRVIIIDACRDNPFARVVKAERMASFSGLGAVEPNSIDTLIAYAAKPGTTAQDGGGDHSPFAAALIDNLFVPGLDIRLAFGRVRDEVLKKTGYMQEPFVYGSLGGGNIALVPAPSQPVAATDLAGEKSDYALVEKIGTKGAWQVFLKQHPTGFYADLARQQMGAPDRAPDRVAHDKTASTPAIAVGLADTERQAELKRQADEAARQKAEQEAALAAAQRAARTAEQARLDAERHAARTREEEASQAAFAKRAAEAEAARKQAEAEAARKQTLAEAAKQQAEAEGAKQAAAEQARLAAERAKQQARPSLPSFPWPPPAASADYVLPQSLFGSDATVGEETSAILSALEQNGYVERSFYGAPDVGGVALITRLERIKDDGSPASQRWGREYQISSLNLGQFLSGLFYADPGHYRVIVFVIAEKPFSQSPSQQLSGKQAGDLLKSGADVLPPEVAQRPVEGSHCKALIYEFANDGNELHKVESSHLTGKQHLEKAGLLATLEKSH
jgi:Caspase domain